MGNYFDLKVVTHQNLMESSEKRSSLIKIWSSCYGTILLYTLHTWRTHFSCSSNLFVFVVGRMIWMMMERCICIILEKIIYSFINEEILFFRSFTYLLPFLINKVSLHAPKCNCILLGISTLLSYRNVYIWIDFFGVLVWRSTIDSSVVMSS